jgi:ATP-dependent DNA helicase DinG
MPKRSKENAQAVARAAPQLDRTQILAAAPDLKTPTIAEIFGPGGAIEKYMPQGYEHRPSQLEMAELVEGAFQEKRHLIVEAGTGTGKTLAYLIPAIRSGRRVVISTATKSLQEQLFEKDIPFLQKHFAPELKVAVMKGRGNFRAGRRD